MKILLLALVFSISSVVVYGQNGLLKTIGGAAKNKVEQQDFNSTRTNKEKLDNEDRPKSSPAPAPSSRSVEPAVDSTEAPITPQSSQGGGYDESYSFTQKLSYEMESYTEKKGGKMNMSYFYSDGAIMTTMPVQNISMIFDFGHETMIMLNEGEKTAFVMPSKTTEAAMSHQSEKSNATSTVTKTGKTKKILGYICDEYLILNEDTKSLVWVTTEIGIDYNKAAKVMGGQGNVNSGFGDLGDKGLMMEMTSFKKEVAQMHMILTEYKEETTTKSLSGYAVTSH